MNHLKVKRILISIYFVFLLIVVGFVGLIVFEGFVYEVSAGIHYVGGSGAGNYTNIQEAVNNASDGDTIFVYDDGSPYYSSWDYFALSISKRINLIGENKETTIIDGGGEENVIDINADGVMISGFTIQNSEKNTDWETYAGINLGNVENCKVFNNHIINNYIGIKIGDNSVNNMIIDNNILKNQVGVSLSASSKNNLIKNNNISSNKEQGIQIWSSDSNEIENNAILNNKIGIETSYSDHNKISGNQVFTNEYGIWLTKSSYANEIVKNNISSNSNTGLRILDSTDNIIYHNNFLNNHEQVYDRDDDNIWNNENNEGNYWSDYQGLDNGKDSRKRGDGIGDTNLPHNGYDNYPFMYQIGISKPSNGSPPDDPSESNQTKNEESKNNLIMITSLAFLVVIVVVILLILIYLSRKKKHTPYPPQPQNEKYP